MAISLSLNIEVAGCSTSCMHCWARGKPYPAMPIGQIDRVLDVCRRFCTAHNYGLSALPMHEVSNHPEAAYYCRAIATAGDEQAWVYPRDPERIEVVCRPGLDVHSGMAGLYGQRHGNLQADDPVQVLGRAIAHGQADAAGLYFSTNDFPPIHQLVATCGDPCGRKLYWGAPEMRNRWLDLALAPHRKY